LRRAFVRAAHGADCSDLADGRLANSGLGHDRQVDDLALPRVLASLCRQRSNTARRFTLSYKPLATPADRCAQVVVGDNPNWQLREGAAARFLI